jgi:hypothetical protein
MRELHESVEGVESLNVMNVPMRVTHIFRMRMDDSSPLPVV